MGEWFKPAASEAAIGLNIQSRVRISSSPQFYKLFLNKKQMRKTITMLSLMLAFLFITTLSYGQYSSSAIQKGSEQALKVQTDSVPNQLQEIVVTAKKVPLMTKVGPYSQPLWTTMRMFAS